MTLLDEEDVAHPDRTARHAFDAMQVCQALLAMAFDNASVSSALQEACEIEAAELRGLCRTFAARALAEWTALEGAAHVCAVGAAEVLEELDESSRRTRGADAEGDERRAGADGGTADATATGSSGGTTGKPKVNVLRFLYEDADDMDELLAKVGVDNEANFGDRNVWTRGGVDEGGGEGEV